MAVDAMRDGAVDFVEKPYDKDRLLRCIRNAVERDAEYRRTQVESADINQRLGKLTEREREVLDLLVDGKTPVQVATLLGTSRHTVGNQRASILEKMGADTVVDLVNMVARVGGTHAGEDAE
jgi:two-component system response regulator FixJ